MIAPLRLLTKLDLEIQGLTRIMTRITPAPVGFQYHFIHIRHSGRIYDGYDPDRENPYEWCFGPHLLTDVPERLPAMTNRADLEILLPSHWQSPAATRAILATCA